MIDRIIGFSIRRRGAVIAAAAALGIAGVLALYDTPIDAIPDLSENQVIVFVDWLGHSPQELEDQATGALSVALQGLDGVRVVRSSSEFNFALIHLIYADHVSLAAARREVGERLTRAATTLPPGAQAYLAPDSPATGQIFWYTLSGSGYDLAYLRDLQDGYVGRQLSAVPGVAEVATVGGMVAQYQIDVDPGHLQAAGVTLGQLAAAVRQANRSLGGDVIHQSGAEYVVRGLAPLRAVGAGGGEPDRRAVLAALESLAVPTAGGGALRLADLASVSVGPQLRRGVFEQDGNEVVGGVVAMRGGENPLELTRRLQEKIAEISPGLPAGVRVTPVYDRTRLIEGAVRTVSTTLLEAIVAASVCVLLVLLHVRTALVIAVTLPLATLASFAGIWLLRKLGLADVQTNAMSLAGIAVSIGVLVDVAIVVAENAMHTLHGRFGSTPVSGDTRPWVLPACRTVGRPVFFSVLIMLLSFLPVFALSGAEGKMFRPLATTKSLALAAAAVLAITLVPALCSLLVKGRLKGERESWLVRSVMDVYRPVLTYLMRRPGPLVWLLAATFLLAAATIGNRTALLAMLFLAVVVCGLTAATARGRALGIAALVAVALVCQQHVQPLGVDALVPLDEGTVMDMPITVPRIAVSTAADDLKARDMVLCRFPEVEMVVGKAGRAETPLDPAPLDMIETMIDFRPRAWWPRRKLAPSDARQIVQAARDALAAQGLADFADSTAGSLLDEATSATLERFDRQQREFAYQRQAEFGRELGPRLRHFAVERAVELMRQVGSLPTAPDAGQLVQLASLLPPELARRLGQRPAPTDLAEVARRTADGLVQLRLAPEGADLLRAPLGLAGWLGRLVGAAPATFTDRLHAAAAKEYESTWQSFARKLDEELVGRGAETVSRLACEELLARAERVEDGLAEELLAVERWRHLPPPVARGAAHHGTPTSNAPPATVARSKLHAVQRALVERYGPGLLLWRAQRQELIGFGGELDLALQMPGWTNVWTSPIQNRVDMLATGVNTAVGVRVLGHRADDVARASEQVAGVLRQIDGAANVAADQVRGKGYLEVRPDPTRVAAAGVDPAQLNDLIEAALGGIDVTTTLEGRQRRTVRLRLDRALGSDEQSLARLPVPAADGGVVALADVADVRIVEGPASIKSENGLLRNYVRAGVRGRSAAQFVEEARRVVAAQVALPEGVVVEWTGQFEHEQRARRMLGWIVPLVVGLIFAILYWTYRDAGDALLMLLAVPGALAGGLIFQWLLGYAFSVTVWVGYVACFGMAASTGIVMLVYLRQAVELAGGIGRLDEAGLRAAVLAGAVHRLRPKLLTEGTTVLGLAPMLWATGVGAEIVRPMAAPVLGGILIADEVIDLLLPVLFFHTRRWRLRKLHRENALPVAAAAETQPSDASNVLIHAT